MALDFPSSPSVGQAFSGYIWNGYAWGRSPVQVSDGDKGDIVVSGSGSVWSFDSAVVTAAGRALLDDADAAAQRTTLGAVAKAGDTMTGTLVMAANTTGAAGLRLPQSNNNPTTPVDGDIAHNTDGTLYWYAGGWKRIVHESDTLITGKVLKAGDTMTGSLAVKNASYGGVNLATASATSSGLVQFTWNNSALVAEMAVDANWLSIASVSGTGRGILVNNAGNGANYWLLGSGGQLIMRGNNGMSKIFFERDTGAAGGHIRYDWSGSPVSGLLMVNANGYYVQIREDGWMVMNGSASFATSVSATNFYGTYNPPSDKRLKEDLGEFSMGLAELLKLKIRRFKYKDTAKLGDREHVGVIAQDAEKTPLGPLLVKKTDMQWGDVKGKDMRTISPDVLIFSLINAVRTLEARVADLEAARA